MNQFEQNQYYNFNFKWSKIVKAEKNLIRYWFGFVYHGSSYFGISSNISNYHKIN